ncbi:ribonuclease H2 subunit A isoform X2 [Nematostella vectensis]|uniref:ribonuclease H2 subunit A isoform X2 n=1 Tax=Nematostella vectensis TaxID=45351 RepID=UPI0020770F0A|nr:ribonuclease H2 subunit A isoform X2 [Nematostella vectensis]
MDFEEFKKDNSKNCIIKSKIPEIARNEPCCVGIDEAGRGPVLGPMVYGICYCPLSKAEELKNTGFADSKTLTEEEREALFKELSENCHGYMGWVIDILTPNFLSNCMLQRTKCSLNEVSHNSAIGLIRLLLDSGVKVQEVYVDTVGPAEKYQDKLQKIFPEQKIVVTPKADAKFPIVSAASVCAKVSRDRVISAWEFSEDIIFTKETGSGYPSDPTTKKWLADNLDRVFGFPQLVRFSWSTCSNILDNKAVPVTWDDDDDDSDEDEATKNSAPITSFFSAKTNDVTATRHRFFQERNLESLEMF